MSELFTHKKKRVKSIRKRKNSLGADDDKSKKKVRFNISSTVYEDVSAMADDSVSIIEPLSIYSNVSPPGELADVSLPHSAFSVPQNSLRPHANSTASQTQSNIPIEEENSRTSVTPRNHANSMGGS